MKPSRASRFIADYNDPLITFGSDDESDQASLTELAAYALAKSRGGPFIGPKGGKWADPQHTIHWDADYEADYQELLAGRKAREARQQAAAETPNGKRYAAVDAAILRAHDRSTAHKEWRNNAPMSVMTRVPYLKQELDKEFPGVFPVSKIVTALTAKRHITRLHIAEFLLKHLEQHVAKEHSKIKKSHGQLFIGPRGGKWADPKHTISYDPDQRERGEGPGTKSRDEARLLKKIRRRPPGEGAEVTLNHHELNTILNHGRFALVSAATNSKNQMHTGRTKADEAAAHEALRKRLVEAGYMHTGVVGRYGGREDTFLVMVHDATSHETRGLGVMFQQDSVIFSERGHHRAYYTYDDIGQCSHGGGWTEKEHAKDFYTQVKHPNGTSTRFTLNIDFDHRKPCDKSITNNLEKSLDRPPAGYGVAPRSHHGGWRKKIKGEWSYWYPGKGVVGKPRKDDEKEPTPKQQARQRAFGSFVKVTPGRRLPVYEESRAKQDTNPGLWKMENGVFHMKRVRTFEGAPDDRRIRSTRNEPDVDDHTKMQLITEYGPLIRKEARDAARLHGIARRSEIGAAYGEANQTAVELQHGGIEGMLHAIAAYRGGQPFGMYAQQYVRDYTRLEAGRQGSVSHLPARHVANLRRFIAARVKAQVKLRSDNPTSEQIARFFDLRLKHVHTGLAPVLRNELVPMEGYKLAVGRHGTGLAWSDSQMRDRENRRSRVEWCDAFSLYLSGGRVTAGDGADEISSAFNFGTAFSTEDQIVVKDQLEHVFERMSDLRHKFTLEGRAPGRYETKTTYRVDNMADLLKRRLGLGKYDEHSIAELAMVVPVYRRTKDGWVEAGERMARDYMQRFIEIGMDHLRGSTDNLDHTTKYVITQAANAVAPKERLPTGPTYSDSLRAHAQSIPQAAVEAFRAAQIKKFARGIADPGAAPPTGASLHASESYRAVIERNEALTSSMAWLANASHEAVAMEAARQSEFGRKLAAEMHTAMTRFVEVERVSTHEGIAHMRNPSTGAHEAVRVHLGYDRYFGNPSIRGSGYSPSRMKPARQRTGNRYWQAIGQHPDLQRLATDPDLAADVATSLGALGPMDKAFKMLNDAILNECERWPRMMELISSADRLPTPVCRAVERMIGL